MRRIKKNSVYDVHRIIRYLYQCFRTIFLGLVSVAQLVAVTDCAVLGGVSSNSLGSKYFVAFTGIVESLLLKKLFQIILHCS